MRVIEIVLLNAFAWLVLHMGIAWLGEKTHKRILEKTLPFFKKNHMGSGLGFYEKFLQIKKWKSWMPDGSSLFKNGFTKKNLKSTNLDYLNEFALETCRGEIVHWVVLLSGFLFFLWNDAPIAWVMVAYGIFANLPCIFLLQYNRIRIWRITSRGSVANSIQPDMK